MGALTEKLRHRLRQYVTGDIHGFTQLHASEAERLAEGTFGEAMLHTIGCAHSSNVSSLQQSSMPSVIGQKAFSALAAASEAG